MSFSLPDFAAGRVLVIGDTMLDRYWHGATQRISPEAPVPVVDVQVDEFRAGGAGNVALNAATVGAHVHLIALVGPDEAGRKLQQRLNEGGVHCTLLEAPEHPTITKLRVISRHQQLIRLDFEQRFLPADSKEVVRACGELIDEHDVLVLSDYGKGTLAHVEALIGYAIRHDLPMVVDPKGADFARYRGAMVITPNMAEFEAVVGHCDDEADLVKRGERLRDSLDIHALLITRSEKGMTLLARGQPALHLPAHTRDVYDVTGAGDTVVAMLGAALGCGCSLREATVLANMAAGIVVGKLGTATVSPVEMQRVLTIRPELQTVFLDRSKS